MDSLNSVGEEELSESTGSPEIELPGVPRNTCTETAGSNKPHGEVIDIGHLGRE
jgi:hypothetical protein